MSARYARQYAAADLLARLAPEHADVIAEHVADGTHAGRTLTAAG